ncbi:heme-binding protein [Variovorax sp. RTB1]|uniref:GlcG/HbpS family heme-binding protein n=1 Tax=Variovorax sp. RTB1 TaxID=3048631 RepID=UPI002B22F6F2|nr:heme-binding protein [Variovorax sp. RTB1]MEB0112494.1 heme-binding protein [Variovorax sp. RTB1]
MSGVIEARLLTLQGAQRVLQAAIGHAHAIGQPMCIAVVDLGGNLLAFARMDGSKALSIISSNHKAVTAAMSGTPTGGAHTDVELQIAMASDCKWTNLIGGLPIRVEGYVVGAVAAGSGNGSQDLAVARAGAAAIAGADLFEDFVPMGAEDTGIIRGKTPRRPERQRQP